VKERSSTGRPGGRPAGAHSVWAHRLPLRPSRPPKVPACCKFRFGI
jgi:hypothetical protein